MNVNVNVNVMDAKRARLDSKCEGVDIISQLPDDVIIGILSFLPLTKAARWSDLWRHTTSLNLDLYMEKPKYIELVNWVLESHKSHHLKEFKISCPLLKSDTCTLTKWLEFVISRGVEVLELDFSGEDSYRQWVALEDVLRVSNITNQLRSLLLSHLVVSGEAIGLLSRNCPLLERLSINTAHLTTSVFEVRSSLLKHLEIHNCCSIIQIYAPNLTFIKIVNSDECLKTGFIIHAPKLVSAYLWTISKAKLQYALIRRISSQLTTLNCTVLCSKGFMEKGLLPQMPKLRELIVTYNGHSIRPIISSLCALPSLEELEVQYSRMNLIRLQSEENVAIYHYHLKVFKFTNFDADNCEHMELMSYILDNCVVLEKIYVKVRKQCLRIYTKHLLQLKVPTHIELIMN